MVDLGIVSNHEQQPVAGEVLQTYLVNHNLILCVIMSKL